MDRIQINIVSTYKFLKNCNCEHTDTHELSIIAKDNMQNTLGNLLLNIIKIILKVYVLKVILAF